MKINTRPSLLAPLVGPSYMLHRGHRQRLNNYGKRVMEQVVVQLANKVTEIRMPEVVEDPEATERDLEAKQSDERLTKEE